MQRHRRSRLAPFGAPLRATAMAAVLLLIAGSATAQPAPSGVAEETVVTAKIVDIDPNSHTMLVQGPRGNLLEAIAGEETANLGQVRKGDILEIRQGEAIVARLEPIASKAVALAESVERTSHATGGGMPGVTREVTTTVTAEITRVDPANRRISLRGPRETLRTVSVRDPAIDLSQVRPGQMARIVYREVVTIAVKAPAANMPQ